jgi:hypothetical protein
VEPVGLLVIDQTGLPLGKDAPEGFGFALRAIDPPTAIVFGPRSSGLEPSTMILSIPTTVTLTVALPGLLCGVAVGQLPTAVKLYVGVAVAV